MGLGGHCNISLFEADVEKACYAKPNLLLWIIQLEPSSDARASDVNHDITGTI